MTTYEGTYKYGRNNEIVCDRCRLTIYRYYNDLPLVVMSEPQGKPSSMSVTNACEKIATKVIADKYPLTARIPSPGHVLWIEHYPATRNLEERFAMITFDWNQVRTSKLPRWKASNPRWHSVTRAWVEELIGKAF